MSRYDGNQVEVRLDERRGGLVAFVTINNSSRLNSMNSALMDEFVETRSPLAANAELRAFVLTGTGDKAFVGGADIREMSALAGAEDARRFITRLHRCCDAVRAIPVFSSGARQLGNRLHSAARAEYDVIGWLTYCFRSPPILPPGRCEQKA